jgi:putative acetyltransferase
MDIELKKAQRAYHDRLFDIWQTAVAATHHFLSEQDAKDIAVLVKEQYIPHAELLMAVGDTGVPMAFIGMTDNVIDALFVHADYRGQGIGGAILQHMQSEFDALTLDVNEGNPGARAFYEKHGFKMTGRSETDDQGRPYPLIHMAWER